MSGDEPSPVAAADNASGNDATDDEIPRPTEFTIADAARAVGTGRHLIRRKLHAGEFPNATKDPQGFWRIPERDLLDAGLGRADVEVDVETVEVPAEAPAPPPAETSVPKLTEESVPPVAESDEVRFLRIEVLELRHRAERAEALLEAERRLSEERARALEAERSSLDAVYQQTGLSRPMPRPPDSPRADWQASMRAARERDLEQRAQRDKEHAPRRPRPASSPPKDAPSPEVSARTGDQTTLTEAVDTAASQSGSSQSGSTQPGSTQSGSEGRRRWRRR